MHQGMYIQAREAYNKASPGAREGIEHEQKAKNEEASPVP
jgi:hypothetical protein